MEVPDFVQRDWPRRAVELDPEDGDAKVGVAIMLALFGQVERAIELTRQAIARDPLRAKYFDFLANYYFGLNRLEEAEEAIRKCIELQPGFAGCLGTLVDIEIQRGNAKGALAAAHQLPPGRDQDEAITTALQIGNDRAAADAALKNFIERDASSNPYAVGRIYAVRNDVDKTFEWLDRAWGERDLNIGGLLYDPPIVRYKNDPRFAAFCRKVGLPVLNGNQHGCQASPRLAAMNRPPGSLPRHTPGTRVAQTVPLGPL